MSTRPVGPGRACAHVLAFALAIAVASRPARGEDPSSSGSTAAPTATPTPTPATATSTSTATPPAPQDDIPELEEIVVVGRRPRGQVARDPTASATVIAADRFGGEAKGVAELVATAPGVAVNDYGGLGQLATISIRGATADGVLVLLDGLPLNTAAGGGVDLASIPRQWIDRIEIVRGAEGALYGAGALGGVVNVVTRSGGGASAEATGGSFGTWAAAADGAAGGPDAWILAAATGERTSGRFTYLFDPQPALGGSPLVPTVRENNATARGGVLVKGALSSPSRRWDLLLSLSGGRRELPGSPYQLTPDDWQRDARALASIRGGARVAPGFTLALRATARADLIDVERSAAVTRQRGGAGGAELEAVHEHPGGVLSARVSAGGEQLRGDGLGEVRRRETLSAAVAEDLRAGPLRVGPAVRVDRIGPFSGWSAKLGAAAPLGAGLSLRASAGRSFRAPSFSELFLQQGVAAPNPDLRPEIGLGADAALAAEGRAGFAALGAHATRYEDLVFYQPVGLGRLKPFNAGRTFAGGLELEGATAPLGPAGLALEGSYTWLRTEILRGGAAALGNDVPRKPRHRLFARASAADRRGVAGLHVEAHVVGPQFEDDFNQRRIAASTVWNAGTWLRLWARPLVRAQLEVKNLLDDQTLLDPIANPLPGRMVLLTLRVESNPSKQGRPPP